MSHDVMTFHFLLWLPMLDLESDPEDLVSIAQHFVTSSSTANLVRHPCQHLPVLSALQPCFQKKGPFCFMTLLNPCRNQQFLP